MSDRLRKILSLQQRRLPLSPFTRSLIVGGSYGTHHPRRARHTVLRRARDTVFHLLTGFGPAQHKIAENITELAVAYPASTLNETEGRMSGPAPGERAPVNDANRKPVSAGDRPVFTVYAQAGADAEQLIACYPTLFDPDVRPPFEPGGIWIVRPDGYVGFRGDSDSWAAADNYLGKLKWPQGEQTVKLG